MTSDGVVAKTNPGEGAGVAATSSAAGLEFMAGKAMTYVDFSKYLADNNLDLADFTALQIAWGSTGCRRQESRRLRWCRRCSNIW